MKIGIYSPFTSPPITPHTSNKLNEVDLMGREWFETPCLRGRRAKGVVMLRFTFNTKKLTKMGICSTKLENLSPANLLPHVNWYLLSLLQLRIRFNSELTPISDTLPSRSSTAPISISSIVRSTLKSILVLVQHIANPSDYSSKISRW
jgi:hypothetical protein